MLTPVDGMVQNVDYIDGSNVKGLGYNVVVDFSAATVAAALVTPVVTIMDR